MTRILFIPNDTTTIHIESALSLEDLVPAVNMGIWQPSEEMLAALPPLPKGEKRYWLRAVRLGKLVLIYPNLLQEEGDSDLVPLPLTQRQLEVLQCLADGLSIKEAAQRLNLGTRTVSMVITALKNHLRTNSLTQTVSRGIALGLCRPAVGPEKSARSGRRKKTSSRPIGD